MPSIEANPIRRGRPRNEAAVSHAHIMDAVYELLQETSARDLTMEAIAKRAKVGKPTLYKWWPSKAALVMAMFHERLAKDVQPPRTKTAEESIRFKMQRLIVEFNGLFGKVMADLIAEGQSDPAILRELYESHLQQRRAFSPSPILNAAWPPVSWPSRQFPNFWWMRSSRRSITDSSYASLQSLSGTETNLSRRRSAVHVLRLLRNIGNRVSFFYRRP